MTGELFFNEMVSTKRISGIPLSLWFSREFNIVSFSELIDTLDAIKNKTSKLTKKKRELLIDTINLMTGGASK